MTFLQEKCQHISSLFLVLQLEPDIDQYVIYTHIFYFYFRNYNCLLMNMELLNNLNCRQRRETYDRVEKVRNQFLQDIEDFQKHKIDFINNRLVLNFYNSLLKMIIFLLFFIHLCSIMTIGSGRELGIE